VAKASIILECLHGGFPMDSQSLEWLFSIVLTQVRMLFWSLILTSFVFVNYLLLLN